MQVEVIAAPITCDYLSRPGYYMRVRLSADRYSTWSGPYKSETAARAAAKRDRRGATEYQVGRKH